MKQPLDRRRFLAGAGAIAGAATIVKAILAASDEMAKGAAAA